MTSGPGQPGAARCALVLIFALAIAAATTYGVTVAAQAYIGTGTLLVTLAAIVGGFLGGAAAFAFIRAWGAKP
jgi:hypothetical protein